MEDAKFFQENYSEFVHKKVFDDTVNEIDGQIDDVKTTASQALSTASQANSTASQAQDLAENAVMNADHANDVANSAAGVASQAIDDALDAQDLAKMADRHAVSAGVVASAAGSLATSGAISVDNANSLANRAFSQAQSNADGIFHNTQLINQQRQALDDARNDIQNNVASAGSIFAQLNAVSAAGVATQASATANADSLSNLQQQITTNSVNISSYADSCASQTSAVQSQAQHNLNLINQNSYAITQNSANLMPVSQQASNAGDFVSSATPLLSQVSDIITPHSDFYEDFNYYTVGTFLVDFSAIYSATNAPAGLPNSGTGKVVVNKIDSNNHLEEYLVHFDDMKQWHRYQNSNGVWTPWVNF